MTSGPTTTVEAAARARPAAVALPADRPALLFPGQGSETPELRAVVERERPDLLRLAVEVVGEDPFAALDRGTRFVQPAVLCASLALWSAADAEPACMAGHSLGELAALAAAGSLDEEDALRLVALRGRLMDRAGGGMLAVIGRGAAVAAAAAADAAPGVTIANDNAPNQVVLSGSLEALERARRALGGRVTAQWVPVAAAFHSPAMAPALPQFEAALAATRFRAPRVPVFSSITAMPFDDVGLRLAQALVRPVRWRETLAAIHAAGVRSFVEVGPGNTLTAFVKRAVRGASAGTLATTVLKSKRRETNGDARSQAG